VREILSTHVYSTTILPTKSGRIINIRKPGIPEGRHKAIYEALAQVSHFLQKIVKKMGEMA